MRSKKIIAILLSFGMFASSCYPVYATELQENESTPTIIMNQEEEIVSDDISQSAIMEDSTINSDISDISDSSIQDDSITEEETDESV